MAPAKCAAAWADALALKRAQKAISKTVENRPKPALLVGPPDAFSARVQGIADRDGLSDRMMGRLGS